MSDGFTANIVSPPQSSMPWCRQKQQQKTCGHEPGRPDLISAPLLSDAQKRKLKLEISSAAAD